jgi:hypothetical protein
MVFRAYNGTLSAAGSWCSITTNSAPTTNYYTLMVPPYNMPGTNTAVKKTNDADFAIELLSFARTNAHAETWQGNSNFVGRTSAQDIGNKRFTNSVFDGGRTTNTVIGNGTNVGAAFSSPGSAASSEQFGGGALATNTAALAIGNGALAGGVSSTAIGLNARAIGSGGVTAVGNGAEATNEQAVAYGPSARAYGTNTIAIGSEALASTNNNIAIGTTATATVAGGIAIGNAASSAHLDSVAIGTSSSTTTSNQIQLGSSSHLVSVTGALIGTSTNLTLRGTNNVEGDVAYTARVNTSLANGNNAGVLLGTNVYLRLLGPTAAYTLAGFSSERAGAFHILQLTNPAISITIGNESGVEPTAANRILTGTGGDLTLTNNPAFLQIIRDGAADRWRVVTHSR